MAVHALPDGRTLTVRPSTVADVDGLVALYEGLDADDRYRRFFSLFQPDRAFIERLATARDAGGDEIVAVVGDGDGDGRVVAEAGYRLLPDGDGELSMVVARAWRGWLGPHLLDALLRRAARRGVRNLRADVLTTNAPMVRVLCARGWAMVPDGEWSVGRFVIGTTGRTPSWPARRTRPRLVVEVPGGRWRDGPAAIKAGFDVLACPGPGARSNRCPALCGRRCPLVDGADVVVTCDADGDEVWDRLAAARPSTHAGVPVIAARGLSTAEVIQAVRDRVPAAKAC